MEREQSDLGPYVRNVGYLRTYAEEREQTTKLWLVQNGLIPMQGFRFLFNIGGFKHIKLTTVDIWVVYSDTDTCMHI